MIELVDFNEIYGKGKGEAKEPAKKTRRGRTLKKLLRPLHQLKLLKPALKRTRSS